MLIVADYNQIELRIIGQLACDPKYIEAYQTNQDLHKITAASLFHVIVTQVTKTTKKCCKIS